MMVSGGSLSSLLSLAWSKFRVLAFLVMACVGQMAMSVAKQRVPSSGVHAYVCLCGGRPMGSERGTHTYTHTHTHTERERDRVEERKRERYREREGEREGEGGEGGRRGMTFVLAM
jgi:hypothetical protein